MSLLRHGLRLHISPAAASRLSPTAAVTKLVPRAYSSKKAKHGSNVDHSERATTSGSKRSPVATTSLTPGSQQVLSNPAAREEHARASAAMASSVEWFRREVAQLEVRASGRVTPQLLDPVRVSLSHATHKEEGASSSSSSVPPKVRLEEISTVGVRDGSSLVVTVFDPQVSEAFSHPSAFFFLVWRSCDPLRRTRLLTMLRTLPADVFSLIEFEARPRRSLRRQDTGCHPPARRRAHVEDTHTEVRLLFSSLSYVLMGSCF